MILAQILGKAQDKTNKKAKEMMTMEGILTTLVVMVVAMMILNKIFRMDLKKTIKEQKDQEMRKDLERLKGMERRYQEMKEAQAKDK